MAFDGVSRRMSERGLLVYSLQNKRSGEQLTVAVLRAGKRIELKMALE